MEVEELNKIIGIENNQSPSFLSELNNGDKTEDKATSVIVTEKQYIWKHCLSSVDTVPELMRHSKKCEKRPPTPKEEKRIEMPKEETSLSIIDEIGRAHV